MQSNSHFSDTSQCLSNRFLSYSLSFLFKLKNHILPYCLLHRSLLQLFTVLLVLLCILFHKARIRTACVLTTCYGVRLFSFLFHAPFVMMPKIWSAVLTLICCSGVVSIGPSAIAPLQQATAIIELLRFQMVTQSNRPPTTKVAH